MNLRAPILTLFILLICFDEATACQCLGDVESAFRSSDHVLVATVTAAKVDSVQFEVEFEVLELLKGGQPSSPLYVTGAPSLLCGKSQISVGREYVFFVDSVKLRDSVIASAASCHSFLVEGASTEDKMRTLRSIGTPTQTSPIVSARCSTYSSLQSQLRELRQRYADDHRDVKRVRRIVLDLNTRHAAENSAKSLEDICATNPQ